MLRILMVVSSIMLIAGCTTVHETFHMSASPDKAFVTSGDDINIVSVDGKNVRILQDGTISGIFKKKYAFVSLDPGPHQIGAHVLIFDKDCLFTVETDLKKNRTYIVNYVIIKRLSGLRWATDVWVEDRETGEKVGHITKNIYI